VSELNQRVYELFARPLVQGWSNEWTAKLGRDFHPLRFQRWAISDRNPWLWWLGPAAAAVKDRREGGVREEPAHRIERTMAEVTSAGLDYYRDLRDAMSEAAFFLLYGNLFSIHLADRPRGGGGEAAEISLDARELAFVKEALASLEDGGYPEALARMGALLGRDAETIPLGRLELRRDLLADYAEFLPPMPREQMRRIRGEQDIIVRYEPERALHTLPKLLADPADRERAVTLLARLLADPRVMKQKWSEATLARVEEILRAIGADPAPVLRLAMPGPDRAVRRGAKPS
jgi:hypothetical protein